MRVAGLLRYLFHLALCGSPRIDLFRAFAHHMVRVVAVEAPHDYEWVELLRAIFISVPITESLVSVHVATLSDEEDARYFRTVQLCAPALDRSAVTSSSQFSFPLKVQGSFQLSVCLLEGQSVGCNAAEWFGCRGIPDCCVSKEISLMSFTAM